MSVFVGTFEQHHLHPSIDHHGLAHSPNKSSEKRNAVMVEEELEKHSLESRHLSLPRSPILLYISLSLDRFVPHASSSDEVTKPPPMLSSCIISTTLVCITFLCSREHKQILNPEDIKACPYCSFLSGYANSSQVNLNYISSCHRCSLSEYLTLSIQNQK